MLPKSIRWRIQAWHGSLLVLLVTALLATFFVYERNARLNEIDSRLESLLTPLLPRVTPPPGRGPGGGRDDFPGPPLRRNGPPDGTREAQALFDNGQFYYVAWTPGGEVLTKSSNAPAISFPGKPKAPGQNITRARDESREILHYGPNGDCVLIGTSIVPIRQELHTLALWLIVAGVGIVVFGLAGGWWVAGHTLEPISQISAAAEHIASGDLTRRIDVGEAESELGQLVTVLNRTFERLEKSFEQQTRFTADASHELRTPIAVMLTQIQLACSRPRDAEYYRQTLETCGRAAERMRVLVNHLLELARVDSGEFKLAPTECDLARIARESLDFIAPLARQKNAVLRDSLESVTIRADAARISQVVINLLSNALQHNADGVHVSLTVFTDRKNAILRVADNGAGIPAEALPQLFERFYRADKSRARASGGHGLGLAISKAIVEAHGGTITVLSQAGHGAEFVVELPLSAAPLTADTGVTAGR